jgi:hypothetical protein
MMPAVPSDEVGFKLALAGAQWLSSMTKHNSICVL